MSVVSDDDSDDYDNDDNMTLKVSAGGARSIGKAFEAAPSSFDDEAIRIAEHEAELLQNDTKSKGRMSFEPTAVIR